MPLASTGHCAPDGSWQVVLDATMQSYRADRIGDSIYLTGQPSGFSGERQ